ncbi:hypothetical protein LNTAR_07996 [Lentisphaera araneosa HTCC2155]|uniref:Cytochrome C Planctomycete-type domain-containing protein n=1 Tax=Lentisphaera araneosa HTCC2155 TaxID=313628 RepID=A6DTR4_9BACT|nr:c-type cytochrome domain-containing protein [Lentisphaera araneosa]EDM24991.1 hypothetical protein LNTAR_07996 [Lentisphaera araneosa HTCC2155]
MKKFISSVLLIASSASLSASESKVNFEKDLWPILERSCLECHDKEKVVNGKRKRPKGGLRIDSPKLLMYGAKGDPVIIPGDAEESSFYYLTVLDEDDDDIMPAKGPILTKVETELLKKWINQGAHFGSWTGSEPKLSSEQISLVNKLNEGDTVIYPTVLGGIDLYVDLSRLREKGTDKDLKELEVLIPKIQELNLSGTHVKDIRLLAKAVNLERLNLSKTDVTDQSLSSLTQLNKLKILNLYGTKIKSLPELPKSLKKIYLANTAMTQEAITKLAQARPDLEIYSNWDLNQVRAILAVANKNTASFNGIVEVKKKPKKKPQLKSLRAENDFVFEDFESGLYTKWKVTGNAFGSQPILVEEIPKYQGDVNARNKYLVNSHASATSHGGDKAQGTMTSKKFTINKNWIKFLIGGGSHKNKTCLQLIIDGKVVAIAHGHNHNKMRIDYFDTSKLKGKMAQLKIVDLHSGGWGNIGIDEIIFTDKK